MDPVEEVKEEADEKGGMSLNVRMELVESRLALVGICTGLAAGGKEAAVLKIWVMGEVLKKGKVGLGERSCAHILTNRLSPRTVPCRLTASQ
jgi:hypothetical protein